MVLTNLRNALYLNSMYCYLFKGVSLMRIHVVLRSKETGEEYLTSKNRRNNPDRLKLMKYSPKLRRKVLFEEKKN